MRRMARPSAGYRARHTTQGATMDLLEHLIEEHRRVEDLLTQLASSSAGAQRDDLLADITSSLSLHMEVEEREVYPLVGQHLGEDRATEAEAEHDQARDTLAE